MQLSTRDGRFKSVSGGVVNIPKIFTKKLVIISFIASALTCFSLSAHIVPLSLSEDNAQETFAELERIASGIDRQNNEDRIRYHELKADMERVIIFAEAVGALLEKRLQENELITGHELNLKKAAIDAFMALVDESIRVQNDFMLKRTLRVDDAIFAGPKDQYYESDLMELALFRKRIENVHQIFSAFFSERIFRMILRARDNEDTSNLPRMNARIRAILSKEEISALEKTYQAMINAQEHLVDSPVDFIRELTASIMSTPSYQLYLLDKDLSSYRNIENIITRTQDFFTRTSHFFGRQISRGFGFFSTRIRWGRGALNQNPQLLTEMKEKLRPLDILFERRTKYLSDRTTPGHWSHIAIWLGTEQSWRSLGIWDNPELAVFQRHIEKGYYILEVRRWGVVFSSAKEFSNLDEIAAIRVRTLSGRSPSRVKEVLLNLKDQLNKRFDHTFNALLTDRITPMDLVNLTYGAIAWPYERNFNRFVIRPDHMASLVFYQNSPLDFVFYAGTGKKRAYQQKDKRDFARVLRFYEHRSSGEFHQRLHSCNNIFYRHRGALRVRRECQREFIAHQYNYEPIPIPLSH